MCNHNCENIFCAIFSFHRRMTFWLWVHRNNWPIGTIVSVERVPFIALLKIFGCILFVEPVCGALSVQERR